MKINERQLRGIIKESVKRVLNEAEDDSIVEQFAQCITELDENSANYIAGELIRIPVGREFMSQIIEHMNGYGYGGPSIDGDTDDFLH